VAQSDLSMWLASVSLSELRSLIAAKEKLDDLLRRKAALERDPASIEKQMASIRGHPSCEDIDQRRKKASPVSSY